MCRHGGLDQVQEAAELLGTMPRRHLRNHLARGDIERGVEVGGAVANVVMCLPCRHPGHQRQHWCGAVERLDLGLLIDAQHDRSLGRVEVPPDDVTHFVDEQRIQGELERLDLMRLERERRQIRLTAVWLIPVAAAIERVDQCVALAGCPSSVFTITRSTSSSLIERGFPGRGSSWSPSRPCRANRPRHLPTVEPIQPNSAAIAVLERPSAAANTIRHRNANACEPFGRRAHRSNVSRSSSVTTTSARCAMTAPNRRRQRRRSTANPRVPAN